MYRLCNIHKTVLPFILLRSVSAESVLFEVLLSTWFYSLSINVQMWIQNLSHQISVDQFFLAELSEVFRRTSWTRNLYPNWSVIFRRFLVRYPNIWVRRVTQRWWLYKTWWRLNTGSKLCERSNSKTLTRPSIRYFSLRWKSIPGR